MIGRRDVAAPRRRYILEHIGLPVPYFDHTRARRAESAPPASRVCRPLCLALQHAAAPVSNTPGCSITRARRRRMRDDQIQPRRRPDAWDGDEPRPTERHKTKGAYAAGPQNDDGLNGSGSAPPCILPARRHADPPGQRPAKARDRGLARRSSGGPIFGHFAGHWLHGLNIHMQNNTIWRTTGVDSSTC